jgi:dihydroxyacetone synthase
MAAIGIALWKYTMRYAPHSPDFFNRDRFILSNGHTCLFQYTFLHLTGYKDMTFDQLKSYHSKRYDALCPGHPEIEHEGIEVTTGPLGQGISNAVGIAAAGKHLGATYNRENFPVVSNHIWCMVGDACLQEGVALEAISLAGHWQLNNLTVIYDNNQITCDGTVDITNTEDINKKMEACGWRVIDVEDGCYDVPAIVRALHDAKTSTDRPTFINVRTIIGLGSAVAGQAVAHGAAFGVADVAKMKEAYGFNPEEHFVIPEEVREFFSDLPEKGEKAVKEWNSLLESYKKQHPELGAHFQARLDGEIPEDWESMIPTSFPEKATASRAASGLVFNPIAENVPSFMVGTADLTPSVNMSWKSKQTFQADGKANGSYAGRYVHYGIREHAMAAIANGFAAYHPNMIIPITSTFFMFYLWAAPSVRMGALQRLQVIHVATHDSIGTGEDGPTHQPIELANLFRAMPNLLYIRPGDSEETAGAWTVAIKAKNTPSIISTSRHALPQLSPLTNRAKVAKGAYVLRENAEATLTLIGVGAELSLAVQVADALEKSGQAKVRIISFPCQRLFDAQDIEYKRSVLQRRADRPIVVIEPYTPNGWERYANAAFCMTTSRFGQSLPGAVAYEYFGFTAEKISEKVVGYLETVGREPEAMQEFYEFTEADGVANVRVH